MRTFSCLFALLALLTGMVAAADVSVSARLSHRTAEVGSQVSLQVDVSGGGGEGQPPEVNVDGLEVQYVGPQTSTQIQFINGQVSRETRTTYMYQVVPRREGDFTIPALPVNVDGRTYKTQPVALKVQKGSSSPNGSDPGEQGGQFSAEIDIKKSTLYVGEVIPVEVRLVVDGRVRVDEVTNMPELTGDGFTMQKFRRVDQSQEVRNGRTYRTFTFRTAMTPTKAGKLSIGPCEIPFVAQVPRAKRGGRGPRSMFDSLFGDDDFFDPFGAFAERRRYNAKAPMVELDVKPLPSDGKPKSFSGAVGQFHFDASGSPSQVKIGEPVTMRMKVTGEGNFDRVDAPKLIDPSGWQTYDASSNFDANNELKTSGTKTFEMPVVPETKHQQMPQFEFSYFDPAQGKYVSLRSKPAPLAVQGEPLVAPSTPAPVAVAAPTPGAQPQATPAPQKPSDIVGLRYDAGPRANFSPIYRSRAFLFANGAAGLTALLLLGSHWLRPAPGAARASALRKERDELWRTLRSDDRTAEFYDTAARLVQVETALASGVRPESVDALVVHRVRPVNESLAAEIDRIFEERAARLYAGREAIGTQVSAAERERVLKAIESFRGA